MPCGTPPDRMMGSNRIAPLANHSGERPPPVHPMTLGEYVRAPKSITPDAERTRPKMGRISLPFWENSLASG